MNSAKVRFVLAIISFSLLGVVLILDYAPPSEKVFGIESYYQGDFGEIEDPKIAYGKFNRNVMTDEIKCNTTPSISEKRVITPTNACWFIQGTATGNISAEEIEQLLAEKDGAIFKEGDIILAPTNIEFINSNQYQESYDLISIKGRLGTEYIIEFTDVGAWWCHIDKAEPTKHTELIGFGGKSPSMSIGSVIGQARKSTKVKLYKIQEDGSEQEASLSEYFCGKAE